MVTATSRNPLSFGYWLEDNVSDRKRKQRFRRNPLSFGYWLEDGFWEADCSPPRSRNPLSFGYWLEVVDNVGQPAGYYGRNPLSFGYWLEAVCGQKTNGTAQVAILFRLDTGWKLAMVANLRFPT